MRNISKFMLQVIAIILSTAPMLSPTIANSTEILILKPHVQVQKDFVTLGDLFTNATGYQRNKPLFRSPNLGRQGTVSIEHLIAAAKRMDFTFETPLNQKEITVSRPARIIKAATIEKQIRNELGKQLHITSDQIISLSFTTPLTDKMVPLNQVGKLILNSFTYDKYQKSFQATLSPSDQNSASHTLKISGKASIKISRPVLTHAIKRGDKISTSDIEYKSFDPFRVPRDIVTMSSKIIGLTSTKNLRTGSFLRTSDLETPKMITKNQLVTVLFKKAGLIVKTQGKALDGGAKGEAISVMNVHSKRIVHGIIQSPGLVIIQTIDLSTFKQTAQLN